MTFPLIQEELTHWKRPWCWERSKAGREGDAEDEVAGWHHRLSGHEFGQTPGDGEGQGGLACWSPWGCKESDTTAMTEQLEMRHALKELGKITCCLCCRVCCCGNISPLLNPYSLDWIHGDLAAAYMFSACLCTRVSGFFPPPPTPAHKTPPSCSGSPCVVPGRSALTLQAPPPFPGSVSS